MESFRTIVPVIPNKKKLTYRTRLMLLGSCFSEYIGKKLEDSKILIDNNPFGIVFNPLSIQLQLEKLMEGKEYTQDQLFFHDGIWSSYDHHSKFSSMDRMECLSILNNRLEKSHRYLNSADILFLTFGTAYVYYIRDTDRVVSNCHKIPAASFDRKRATVQEIVTRYDQLISKLIKINPGLQIIFTVSPVRHWKDGPHENQLSKATLLLAIEEICKLYQNALYFPSYEIVMDDLRDYRFYADDMIHPNSVSINYIWDRFKECFMDSETVLLMKEIDQVVQASKHIPLNPKTEAFQLFVRQFFDKIQNLKEQHHISFESEENYFKSYLSGY